LGSVEGVFPRRLLLRLAPLTSVLPQARDLVSRLEGVVVVDSEEEEARDLPSVVRPDPVGDRLELAPVAVRDLLLVTLPPAAFPSHPVRLLLGAARRVDRRV
jgi:hypothetical protein